MVLMELHFHTSESSPCGKVPVKTGLAMYKEAGYGAVVITDHFSRDVYGGADSRSWQAVVERFLKGYQQAKEEGQKLGLPVYLGMELRFPHNENDFLIYGLEEEYLLSHPWIYESELDKVYEDIQKNGMVIFQAHPFRNRCRPAKPEYLNGIEVVNGNPRHDSKNHMAKAWAKEHELVGSCGSDFHQREDLRGYGVYVESLPKSGKELAQILKNGQFRINEKETGRE